MKRIDFGNVFQHRKAVVINAICVLLLIVYVLLGAFVFLLFERDFDALMRRNTASLKTSCVERILLSRRQLRNVDVRHLAHLITERCIVHMPGPRQQWNFLNAALYAFGVLTTLGAVL